MVYSEREYKNLEEKYKQQIQKLQKENEIKTKENKLLKKQNKEKDELIHDLDPNNYRGKYQTAMQENYELKKKTKEVRRKIQSTKNQLRKKQ